MGNYSTPPLCSKETPPAAPGSPAQEGRGTAGASPEQATRLIRCLLHSLDSMILLFSTYQLHMNFYSSEMPTAPAQHNE